MPPKSHDASKTADVVDKTRAIPVRAIHFNQPIKWPGVAGAGLTLQAGRADMLRNNVLYCDNIMLYRDEFVVDGQYFMPKTAACVVCYEF